MKGKKYIDRELAEIFDCSTGKIQEAYKRGKLHGDKNPKTGRVYFSQQDIDDYKKYLSSMISVKDFAERVGVPVETLRTEIRDRKFLAREEEGYENHGYFTESDVGEYLAMKNKQRDNGRMSEERKKILLDRARKLQMNFPKNVNTLFDIAYASNDKKLCLECREIAGKKAREYKEKDPKRALEFVEIYKKTLLMTARDNFDSYLQYIEWNRPADKKFYLPRRPQLKVVVDALQDLADDKLDLLAISLPPGVGKSTLAIFYLTWIGGREPGKPILGGSHSNSFLRGVYDEILRILDKDGEYLWHDVFPKVETERTNAQDLMINLDNPKRFATFEFSSVGSGNAGKVRAESLLYCDDLCSGIEEALSKERLDSLWTKYSTDLRQRKIGNCKELHIATRWSVNDVIGRLERKYGDSSRAKFIVVPALNDKDESNFNYVRSGFSTEFYRDMRETMDDASFKALYMNEPIEREGLLYNEGELRRYFELPDSEPDGIISVCDTKDRGKDYCVMPVAYIYGKDYYIEDCICDNSNPDVVEPRIVSALLKNKVQMSQFEHNNAGGRIAKDIQSEVSRRGGITKITTKFTTSNKETKIIVNAPFVKERFLFKDKSQYVGNSDYGRMMNMLCGYTTAGKNKHDDVPDAMAMLALYAQSFSRDKVQIFNRWF